MKSKFILLFFVIVAIASVIFFRKEIRSGGDIVRAKSWMYGGQVRDYLQGVQSAPRPHIVFVLADDYGFNDIGYRNPVIKTPNMDALAVDGVKLDNYYVQPICTPSRAQLMTGRYQIHTGLQHDIIRSSMPNSLPLEYPTLADKLGEAGYATHMTGKWHLGYYKKECWPTNRGFQSFLGLLLGKGDHFEHTRSWSGYPFPDPEKTWTGFDFRDGVSLARNYTGAYSTHVFSKRATDIIEEHDLNKPMFLYVSFQAVHEPLQVPEHYMEPFKTIQDEKRRAYMGMTYCMDEAVGNITKALKKRGMWENTVLVFSADNGGNVNQGANNWPLRGSKTTLWEGGVRAVGFVSSPLLGDNVRGTINRELIDISDWFPTLVEGVAGLPLDNTHVDGYNIWHAIRDGKPSPRRELLHNIDPYPIPYADWDWKDPSHVNGSSPSFSNNMLSALRYGDWKIITGHQAINHGWYAPPESSEKTIESTIPEGKKTWLFNITADPKELHDLSDHEPGVVKTLLDRLRHYQEGAVPIRYPDLDPDANPALHGGVWTSWW